MYPNFVSQPPPLYPSPSHHYSHLMYCKSLLTSQCVSAHALPVIFTKHGSQSNPLEARKNPMASLLTWNKIQSLCHDLWTLQALISGSMHFFLGPSSSSSHTGLLAFPYTTSVCSFWSTPFWDTHHLFSDFSAPWNITLSDRPSWQPSIKKSSLFLP